MVQAGQATANHGWQWLHGQSMVCHGQVIKRQEPRLLAVVRKNGSPCIASHGSAMV